jgi:hypothetical protein
MPAAISPLLAVVLALGFGEARATSSGVFAIYTQFERTPPKPVTESLKEELHSIMSPFGVRFDWRTLSAARNGEWFRHLAVVTFKGGCNTFGIRPRYRDTGALGSTNTTDGQILSFAEVNCDRIRDFLSMPLCRLQGRHREEAFGRALARVLAHELYHIFTHKQEHGAEGITKPAFSVEDLIGRELCFTEADREPWETVTTGNTKTERIGSSGAR